MTKEPSDVIIHPDPTLTAIFARKFQTPKFLVGSLENLTEKYDPPRLLYRDKEQEKIVDIITGAVKESLPTHLFIFGKSGSGKTATVTHVLDHAQHAENLSRPAKVLIVNCRNQVSHHGLLCQILEQIEPSSYVPSNTSWRDLHNQLLAACRKAGANIVMVLDEVNRLVQKRDEYNALYTLSNMGSELKGTLSTITIIAISNDLHFGEQLEQSVRSRLRVDKLNFAPYNAQQLTEILMDRTKTVFAERGLEEGIIAYCAAKAAQTHGDARQAIGLLYKAAVIASKENAHQVTMHHVLEARSALEYDSIAEGLQDLTAHEKLILLAIAYLVEKQGGTVSGLVTTGMVLEGYRRICQELAMEPLTLQSVNRLLNDIASQGIITTNVRSLGRGKGRTTVVHLTVPPASTIKVLKEDNLFHLGE